MLRLFDLLPDVAFFMKDKRGRFIALNRRNMGRRWPLTPYRRAMKRLPLRDLLRERWQIEGRKVLHRPRSTVIASSAR